MATTSKIIFEPMRRIVFIGNHKRFLSFPKMKFEITYFQVNKKYCPIRLQVYTCIDEKYYNIPILPNMLFSGSTCLPLVLSSFQSPKKLKSYLINSFWTSRFADLNDLFVDVSAVTHFMRHIGSHINKPPTTLQIARFNEYFDLWEKKTKEDPKWVPGLDFFKV
jgi:hypothetical protein